MATTTNYGWTTPNDTDLVKNGASAIRTLGSSIDTTLNNVTNGKNVGLVLLNTTTFSAQTSVSLNSVFNSSFDNYRIELEFSAATGSNHIGLRYRKSGTDYTGSLYNSVNTGINGANTVDNVVQVAGTFIYINRVYNGAGNFSRSFFDCYLPLVSTARTQHTGNYIGLNTAGSPVGGTISGGLDFTDTYDGFTVFALANTISGTIRVYGYRNS